MTDTRKVASVTTHLLFTNLAKSAVLLAFFISVSRILGAESLGVYSLALAITTPLFAFGLLGVRILRLTGPAKITNPSFELGLSLTGILATCLSIVFSLVVFPNTLAAVLLISLFKWSDLFTELYAGDFQLRGATRKLASYTTFWAVIIASVSVVLLIATNSLEASLIGFAACGWFYALSLRKKSSITITLRSIQQIRDALRLGVPLGISGALAALGSTIPQYRVGATLGDEAVGILAIFLYVYALVDIFGAAYGQAWISKIQSISEREKQYFFTQKVGAVSSLAMLPLAIFGVYLFALIAPLIFGAHFFVSSEEAIPLILAITLLPYAHVVATALFARMHYKRSLAVMLFSTGATLLGTLSFVPTFEISGGIYAVTLGIFIRSAVSSLFLKIGK